MSRLRQSFLESIRIMGNNSGCHQLPERSFFYKGKQFPVCARCTGVFIGQAAALIYAVKYKVRPKTALFALAVMGIDWSLQETGVKGSTNLRRFLTGICGGFGLFSIYAGVFKWILRGFHEKVTTTYSPKMSIATYSPKINNQK